MLCFHELFMSSEAAGCSTASSTCFICSSHRTDKPAPSYFSYSLFRYSLLLSERSGFCCYHSRLTFPLQIMNGGSYMNETASYCSFP